MKPNPHSLGAALVAALTLCVTVSPARAAGLPIVTTAPATAVTETGATLHGAVNPNGLDTAAWFEWGTTPSYGNLTAFTNVGSGTISVAIATNLTGLTLNTTYHFRVAARNSFGTSYSVDSIFTTYRRPVLTIRRVGTTEYAISWDPAGTGVLQESTSMRYPPTWVDSPVQANPQTNTLEGTSKFITLMKEGIDYSRNVVGYINLTLTNTYSLIGNQLDNGAGNLVTNMFMGLPTQTVIYKFNGAYAFSSLTYLGARGWTPVAHHQMTCAPGEGVLVKKPATATNIVVAFMGEVMQGFLVNPMSIGFGIYSCMVPERGGIVTVHNYAPANQDTVYRFTGMGFSSKTWLQALNRWNPAGEPVVDVGEAVFINSMNVKDWLRAFTVIR